MAKTVEELERDLKTIGKYAQGIKRTLLGVIVVLCALLVFDKYTALKNAPLLLDRWTATEHAEYEMQHAKEIAVITTEAKRLQGVINKELLEAIQDIRQEWAADRVRWQNMDKKIDRIEKKVLNGNFETGGG